MSIKKEFITKGMKLTHPSGAVTITELEDLRKHKAHQIRALAFLQQQIDQTDEYIKEIEALQKK